MSQKKSPSPKTNVEPPVQLSIWDVLEHPKFEQNLEEEMKLLKYTGEHYAQLKEQVEQQYRKDLATLELAKDNQMKELLKDYPKPEDLAVKYVEVITKKSRLAHHKRELIEQVFSQLVKSTAIDIVNEKAKEKCEQPSQETNKKDLAN